MGGLIRHTNQGGQQAGKWFHPPNINQLLAQVWFFVANLEEKLDFFPSSRKGRAANQLNFSFLFYTFWEIISKNK